MRKTHLDYFLESHLINSSSIKYSRHNIEDLNGRNLYCFVFYHINLNSIVYNLQIFNYSGVRLFDEMFDESEIEDSLEFIKKLLMNLEI